MTTDTAQTNGAIKVPPWIVRRADGTYATRLGAIPVKYRDGEWVDIFGGVREAPKATQKNVPRQRTGPLDGLPALESIALVGGARIREAAARPIVWLWRSYVVAGQIVVLYGAPGGGKTTLLFLLVVARASGVALEVLGQRVEPAPEGRWIVVIEGEQEENAASRKLVKSAEILCGADAPERDPLDRVILIARKEVRLGTTKWEAVKALFVRGLVSDLFVDSLARLGSSDANSETEQVEVYSELSSAIESAPADGEKPTVWLVAHGRKNATSNVDDVSGSVQRAAQGDTILFVRAVKDEDDKVVSSKVSATKIREEPDEWPKAVEFSIARGDLGRWRCVVGGGSARTEDAPVHDRVFAVLDTAKTKNEIREALKLSGERLEQALTVLFAEKRIKKIKKTISGRERDAFARRKQSHFKFPSANASRRGAKRAAETAEDAGLDA